MKWATFALTAVEERGYPQLASSRLLMPSDGGFVGGMTDRTPYAPTLRTQADVEAAWRHIIRPLGWPEPRLWFMFIGVDDVPIPQVSEVTELPAELSRGGCEGMAEMLKSLVDEMGFDRVALLLCRPGRGRPTQTDQRNAATLYSACREAELPVEVIHLATDEDFWPIPYDAAPREVAV